VSESEGTITVAMADPNDATAREAVKSALGKTPYIVQGDPKVIDMLLARLWQEGARNPIRFLVFTQHNRIDEVADYGCALGKLLQSHVVHFQPVECVKPSNDTLTRMEVVSYDLVVFGSPDQSSIKHLIRRFLSRLPTSCLLARRPHWPIQKILLVLLGSEKDRAAVDWAIRIARPSRSTVTALITVPPIPAMYQGLDRMTVSISGVLETDSRLGRHLRRVTGSLQDWEIEGTLRLFQGSPEWEIRREATEGNYDLITVAAEAGSWLRRNLIGDLIVPIMCWSDCPVLITKQVD